ncbi:hypothetical protein Actkin_04287 [Actinokineospora sp. UTMC 2448]|nr:hypothetical protein Actkin_04287 [Actinokineospora sp. UTMC 2448]
MRPAGRCGADAASHVPPVETRNRRPPGTYAPNSADATPTSRNRTRFLKTPSPHGASGAARSALRSPTRTMTDGTATPNNQGPAMLSRAHTEDMVTGDSIDSKWRPHHLGSCTTTENQTDHFTTAATASAPESASCPPPARSTSTQSAEPAIAPSNATGSSTCPAPHAPKTSTPTTSGPYARRPGTHPHGAGRRAVPHHAPQHGPTRPPADLTPPGGGKRVRRCATHVPRACPRGQSDGQSVLPFRLLLTMTKAPGTVAEPIRRWAGK